ncbi:hypothetical protein DAI22_01g151400 [Oryza sativa Japonica Group]|nr:hypothetical protein DAI22_01g151400 [Oryza sativa Japonica Group]
MYCVYYIHRHIWLFMGVYISEIGNNFPCDVIEDILGGSWKLVQFQAFSSTIQTASVCTCSCLGYVI